ncbi:MAG: hypothetical protein C3F13_01220 [Anaerolineales bacterium]|nr:DUF3592 domain-containing protein [Anaerolineae bacterium]PWB56720.1 MAG: hypothetical protein C3F13_01220 [Anaerolineales bacterium]
METQSSGTAAILIVIFLTVLFIAIGVILIFVHRLNKRKAEESTRWLATTGAIKESRVKQGSSMLMSSDEDGESTPVYTPEISYTYQVAGVEYASKRISFGGTKSYSKPENAEKDVALYPVGKEMTVYYDPKNPKEAVLDRTAKISNMILIMGIMFIIIGVVTVVVGALLLL